MESNWIFAKLQRKLSWFALTAHAQNRSIRIENIICKSKMHSDQSSICMNRHYIRIPIKLPSLECGISCEMIIRMLFINTFFAHSFLAATNVAAFHFRTYSQLVSLSLSRCVSVCCLFNYAWIMPFQSDWNVCHKIFLMSANKYMNLIFFFSFHIFELEIFWHQIEQQTWNFYDSWVHDHANF